MQTFIFYTVVVQTIIIFWLGLTMIVRKAEHVVAVRRRTQRVLNGATLMLLAIVIGTILMPGEVHEPGIIVSLR